MSTVPAPPRITKPDSSANVPLKQGSNLSIGDSNGFGSAGNFKSGGSVTALTPSPYLDLSNSQIGNDPQSLYRTCRVLSAISPLHRTQVRNVPRLIVTQVCVRNHAESTEVLSHKTRDRGRAGVVARDRSALTQTLVQHLAKLDVKGAIQAFIAEFLRCSMAVAWFQAPFVRMLQCTKCLHSVSADSDVDWVISRSESGSGKYLRHTCPECGYTGPSDTYDRADVRDPDKMHLRVLESERIHAISNDATGEVDLYYEIPKEVEDLLIRTERIPTDLIMRYPDRYLRAVYGDRNDTLLNRTVKLLPLRKENIFAAIDPTSVKDSSGLPIADWAASAADAWTTRLLQKGNAVNAANNIYPMTVIFPDMTSMPDSIFRLVSVAPQMEMLRDAFAAQRRDPTLRLVSPFPVGQQTIGGDGKALMMHAEIRSQVEMTIAGMGYPIEFFFGGLSYSASSTSIKILSSLLEDHHQNANDFAQWVGDKVVECMGLSGAHDLEVYIPDTDLGNDPTNMQLLASLASSRIISSEVIRDQLNTSREVEEEAIEKDVQFSASLSVIESNAMSNANDMAMQRSAGAQGRASVRQETAASEAKSEAARAARIDPSTAAQSDVALQWLQSTASTPGMTPTPAPVLGTEVPDGDQLVKVPMVPSPDQKAREALERQNRANQRNLLNEVFQVASSKSPEELPGYLAQVAANYPNGDDIATAVAQLLMPPSGPVSG